MAATSRACSRESSSAERCHWRSDTYPRTATVAAGRTIASSVNTAKRRRAPSAFLVEEAADECLRLLVSALTDMMEADHAAAIHEHPRRPRPDRVSVPDREIVVLNDGIEDAELLRGRGDARRRLLPVEFRRVDAHDRQPRPRVLAVPVPQLRNDVLAIDSAVRPEL